MGLKGLKSLFLEEVDEPEASCDVYEPFVEELDVNTENVNQDNLVGDIYNQNDLSDVSKSIFKIEELINSLPKEMPNETKKTTVLTMLSIFGLTVDEVVEDGNNRISIIEAALSAITNENSSVIEENKSNIEQKKLEIQDLEMDNAEREMVIKSTEDKIEAETKRISELIKFIGGAV